MRSVWHWSRVQFATDLMFGQIFWDFLCLRTVCAILIQNLLILIKLQVETIKLIDIPQRRTMEETKEQEREENINLVNAKKYFWLLLWSSGQGPSPEQQCINSTIRLPWPWRAWLVKNVYLGMKREDYLECLWGKY